jgi:hypothetical protein
MTNNEMCHTYAGTRPKETLKTIKQHRIGEG